MSVTVLGAFIIPVALFCVLLKPAHLFPLLVLTSVFQGGSIANGRSGEFEFGIPPFYFVAACIAIRYLIPLLRDGKRVLLQDRPIKKAIVPLLWFWALSVISSFLFPRLFSGIAVYSPREGLESQLFEQATLAWSLSNLAQALFLSLCVISVLAAVFALQTGRQAHSLIRGLYGAVLIVVTVGLLQGITSRMHWSFPNEIFNNNVGYNQGYDQVVDDWDRISSTFSEPSYAGAFLGGIGAGLLAAYLRGKRTVIQLAALAIVCMVLLETTATTGYLAFGATICLLFLYFNPFRGQAHVRRFFVQGWSAIVGLAALAAVFVISPKLSQAAVATSVEKVQGLSFMFRIAADFQALSVVRNTFGLGAGLGSNRPSSLVTSLLSNVGILGTFLFALIIYAIFKLFPGKSAPPSVQLGFFSMAGLLLGQMSSLPEITLPMTWALILVVMVQLNVGFVEKPATRAGLGGTLVET